MKFKFQDIIKTTLKISLDNLLAAPKLKLLQPNYLKVKYFWKANTIVKVLKFFIFATLLAEKPGRHSDSL